MSARHEHVLRTRPSRSDFLYFFYLTPLLSDALSSYRLRPACHAYVASHRHESLHVFAAYFCFYFHKAIGRLPKHVARGYLPRPKPSRICSSAYPAHAQHYKNSHCTPLQKWAPELLRMCISRSDHIRCCYCCCVHHMLSYALCGLQHLMPCCSHAHVGPLCVPCSPPCYQILSHLLRCGVCV